MTASGIGLLAMIGVSIWLGRHLSSQPILLVGYGLVLLAGIAWALGRPRNVLEVGRSKIPARVREGQVVEVELSLRGRRRLTTVVLEEVLPHHLGGPVRFPVPSLARGKSVALSYSFVPVRRGVYEVGPLVAEWSDPFGLTRRRSVLDRPVPIIVHPSTEMVHDRITSRAWEDPPIRPPISKRWPTGFEFYGLRDYVVGDDPRRINWRATARSLDLESGLGRILVRESEQGITDRVSIFLDTQRSSHSPGETSSTFELGVRAAASLAIKHLRDGFAVSVHTNSSPLAVGKRGRQAELPMLDQLATVERQGAPLANALERLLLERTAGSHNIVITPNLDPDAARRLRVLLGRGVSILVALVLWDDTDPATLHRAGLLGCGVVEIAAGAALENVFRQTLVARR